MGKSLSNLISGVIAGVTSLLFTGAAVINGMSLYQSIQYGDATSVMLETGATLCFGIGGIGLGAVSASYIYQSMKRPTHKKR